MNPEATPHGFKFGPLLVEATTVVLGRHVVTVSTDNGHRIEIRCSPQGNFLAVHNKGDSRVVMRDGA